MLAKLFALVLPLGLDTFAVAAALGMVGVTRIRRREINFLFTAFEAGMPLIGLGSARRWDAASAARLTISPSGS